MNMHSLRKQRGAATLVTAVVMLVALTLVALVVGKAVINETKMVANNYRTTQAVAAANYAMDIGVNYFDNGGFDRLDISSGTAVLGNDGVIDLKGDLDDDGVFDDSFDGLSLTSNDGSQSTSAEITFYNDPGIATSVVTKEIGYARRCIPVGRPPGFEYATLVAEGFSDDGVATRTITQCVGPSDILRDGGPKHPLVSQGQVALTGNARIVNRFTDTTIWSGNKVVIGSSATMETFIRSETLSPLSASGNDALDPSNITDRARLLETDDSVDTQLVSNRNLGNGLDIIDNDSSLNTLVGIEFFKNFFKAGSRGELKLRAGSQVYNSIASAVNGTDVTSGLVWVEGDQAMSGGTIGSITEPAIVYIHGNFRVTGGTTIYGVLYVAGKYDVAGTVDVVGTNIVEGTIVATESPATPPFVSGTGTLTLIYWDLDATSGPNPPVGETAVIAGSWRDW